MWEYAIVVIFVILCSTYNHCMAKNTRIFFCCISCLIIILLLGLRFKVGIDTLNYMESFKKIPTFDNISYSTWIWSRMEPGYFVLASICKTIKSGFVFFQLTMAAITNICICIFIYKYTKNPFNGVLFYLLLACLYFTT